MSTDDTSASIGGTGYSLDDLAEYLDSGRQPANPVIDANAECQAALASLERVAALSRDLIDRDATDAPDVDEAWFGSILATISREVRAGRDVPLRSPDPATTLAITEGAIRELVRSAGDAVPGVLVGRCRIDLDAPVTVDVSISVLTGMALPTAADRVRENVRALLATHTELAVARIDVTVTDVHLEGDAS